MSTEPLVQDLPSLRSPSPERERPVGGYAVLMGTFGVLSGGFATWLRRSGRELPEHIAAGDLALMAVATHKASRLIAKDRVTSAVRAPFTESLDGSDGEVGRGRALRRAIGELIVCPYCLGLWIAAAFAAGMIVAPRPTRWIAATLTVLFASDLLQIAYKKAEDTR